MENLQEYVDTQLHIPLGVREAWPYQIYEFLKIVRSCLVQVSHIIKCRWKKKTCKSQV